MTDITSLSDGISAVLKSQPFSRSLRTSIVGPQYLTWSKMR